MNQHDSTLNTNEATPSQKGRPNNKWLFIILAVVIVFFFGVVIISIAGIGFYYLSVRHRESTTYSNSPRAPAATPSLTKQNAQCAINWWTSAVGGGDAKIVGGVREIPAENSAVAELNISNLSYTSSSTGRQQTYSGKGTAIFSRYTDGSWVLSKIEIGDFYSGATTWNPVVKIC